MNFIIELIFILLLGILFYQDVKERQVSFMVLLLGIGIGGYLHFSYQYFSVFLLNVLLNVFLVLFLFAILVAYAKLKMQKGIFEVFGKGDLLFFILMAVSLPTVSFLVVFVFSLIFSLTIFTLLKKRFEQQTVPLAGLQSFFLTVVIILNKFQDSIQLYAV